MGVDAIDLIDYANGQRTSNLYTSEYVEQVDHLSSQREPKNHIVCRWGEKITMDPGVSHELDLTTMVQNWKKSFRVCVWCRGLPKANQTYCTATSLPDFGTSGNLQIAVMVWQ